MDYRTILATGFLLLCGAVFVHSLKSANAFPQGPNVGLGSNPTADFYGSCNNSPIFTTAVDEVFIITDISVGSYPYAGSISLNKDTNTNIPFSYGEDRSFQSGLKVPSNTPVQCTGNVSILISGYYAQP